MKYLHVAILENYEECLVSDSEEGLREQVADYLAAKSLAPLTDEEWSVCITAVVDRFIPIDNLSAGLITYYKTESKLG